MSAHDERRRALLAARPTEAGDLRALFGQPALRGWDVLDADSFERARFLLQHTPCDVLLVDEGLYHAAGSDGLAWLAQQREAPTIFLTGMEPDILAAAYAHGVSLCLPRHMTMEHPEVLAAGLERMAQTSEALRCHRRTRDGLAQCRRQVDRLVHMLWRSAPTDPQRQVLSQRHILERLQEEVARSGRHATVFTVALAEVQPAAPGSAAEEQIVEWATTALSRIKRRCDVAGHYGLRGFMVLMVQTPAQGGLVGCRRLQKCFTEVGAESPAPGGPVRASFGLSSYSVENYTPQSLLSRAEKHLEAARAGQGTGVVGD